MSEVVARPSESEAVGEATPSESEAVGEAAAVGDPSPSEKRGRRSCRRRRRARPSEKRRRRRGIAVENAALTALWCFCEVEAWLSEQARARGGTNDAPPLLTLASAASAPLPRK
eukprot:gene26364-41790_t